MLDKLNEVLNYNPETGLFTWLVSNSNRVKIGDVAGHWSSYGYVTIRLNNKNHPAHRLAWIYMTGINPDVDIDHKDTDRSNNKWSNLRLATRSQNNMNSGLRKDNSSGIRGVSKWRTKWRARCGTKHIGTFESKEKAHLAYVEFTDKLFGDFNLRREECKYMVQ